MLGQLLVVHLKLQHRSAPELRKAQEERKRANDGVREKNLTNSEPGLKAHHPVGGEPKADPHDHLQLEKEDQKGFPFN